MNIENCMKLWTLVGNSSPFNVNSPIDILKDLEKKKAFKATQRILSETLGRPNRSIRRLGGDIHDNVIDLEVINNQILSKIAIYSNLPPELQTNFAYLEEVQEQALTAARTSIARTRVLIAAAGKEATKNPEQFEDIFAIYEMMDPNDRADKDREKSAFPIVKEQYGKLSKEERTQFKQEKGLLGIAAEYVRITTNFEEQEEITASYTLAQVLADSTDAFKSRKGRIEAQRLMVLGILAFKQEIHKKANRGGARDILNELKNKGFWKDLRSYDQISKRTYQVRYDKKTGQVLDHIEKNGHRLEEKDGTVILENEESYREANIQTADRVVKVRILSRTKQTDSSLEKSGIHDGDKNIDDINGITIIVENPEDAKTLVTHLFKTLGGKAHVDTRLDNDPQTGRPYDNGYTNTLVNDPFEVVHGDQTTIFSARNNATNGLSASSRSTLQMDIEFNGKRTEVQIYDFPSYWNAQTYYNGTLAEAHGVYKASKLFNVPKTGTVDSYMTDLFPDIYLAEIASHLNIEFPRIKSMQHPAIKRILMETAHHYVWPYNTSE